MQVLDNYDKYRKYFSDDQFWGKLKKLARKAGIKIVYAALLLYYVLRNPATPRADGGLDVGLVLCGQEYHTGGQDNGPAEAR